MLNSNALSCIFGDNLMDDFFGEPFKGFGGYQSTHEMMKTDVKERDNEYELSIGLPGVNKDDIHAELKDGYLTINATTSQDSGEKDEKDRYVRRERYYGTASRSFYVGEDITQDEIKAKYENGVLTLKVPKKEARKPETEERKYITIEG